MLVVMAVNYMAGEKTRRVANVGAHTDARVSAARAAWCDTVPELSWHINWIISVMGGNLCTPCIGVHAHCQRGVCWLSASIVACSD